MAVLRVTIDVVINEADTRSMRQMTAVLKGQRFGRHIKDLINYSSTEHDTLRKVSVDVEST